MNLKNPFSKKSDPADIGAKDTSEESDGSATNEGIEVQAIEFDKLQNDDRSRSPRKAILFAIAFVVLLFASTITGFGVLRSKKKSALAESSNFSSIDATNTESSTPEVANPEVEDLNVVDQTEPLEPTLPEPEDVSQNENDSTEDLAEEGSPTVEEGSPTVEEPPIDADTSVEASSNTDVTPPAGDELQPGNDNISSESVGSGAVALPWDDNCPNHNLDVSSYCSSSGSISIAAFCFGSKRDGDWYWIRSSAGAATAYDSWDYTEETNGQLTINDLKGGDSYIISLVRDSMQPYDEIISHEFTVPQCQ